MTMPAPAPTELTSTPAPNTPPAEHAPERGEVESLYSQLIRTTQHAAALSTALEDQGNPVAGGRVRNATRHLWTASEDIHAAYHHVDESHTPISRLCARRMRYLTLQAAKRVKP